MANQYNKSILIVDNDRHFANSLSKTLTKEGFQIQIIPEDLIEVEKDLRDEFALILLDVNVPGKWGLSALNSIHTHFPNSRIIVLTASNDDELFHKTGKENIFAVLKKPIKREKVLMYTRRAIN